MTLTLADVAWEDTMAPKQSFHIARGHCDVATCVRLSGDRGCWSLFSWRQPWLYTAKDASCLSSWSRLIHHKITVCKFTWRHKLVVRTAHFPPTLQWMSNSKQWFVNCVLIAVLFFSTKTNDHQIHVLEKQHKYCRWTWLRSVPVCRSFSTT